MIYGVALALVMVLMKTLEYRFLLRKLDVEIYLALVAIICLSAGIWLGTQLISAPKEGLPPSVRQSLKNTIVLSDREADVLNLMAQGCSNQEIADQLFISIHTVKTHSSNLFAKLEVKRRTQAIVKARSLGLLRP